eukprot:TRINITY_DN32017_c0_g1_i1.p1 TRINITY_DN32017_c0_g1~~TRINITY_DN32017_c0_g1_i1.p1  ORF type:complete len:188 (+),score=34.98 TRINITY_DN32017_c0_g1_i1:220-783(+)
MSLPSAALGLCLLTAALQPADGGFGDNPVTEHFDDEFSSLFLKSTKKSYVFRKSKKEEKPVMVVMTRMGCGACQNLKQSVNLAKGETTIKTIASEFLIVHAEGTKADEWQQPHQGYAPQVLFFAPGETQPLLIHGTVNAQPHYFHDHDTILWGMQKTLEVVESGERSNPEVGDKGDGGGFTGTRTDL